jgi:hypothetical protein
MRNLRSRIHAFKKYARDAMRGAECLVKERMEALEQDALISTLQPQLQCHGPQKRATQLVLHTPEIFHAETRSNDHLPRSPRESFSEIAKLHLGGPPVSA